MFLTTRHASASKSGRKPGILDIQYSLLLTNRWQPCGQNACHSSFWWSWERWLSLLLAQVIEVCSWWKVLTWFMNHVVFKSSWFQNRGFIFFLFTLLKTWKIKCAPTLREHHGYKAFWLRNNRIKVVCAILIWPPLLYMHYDAGFN